jgi:hypothetical protein
VLQRARRQHCLALVGYRLRRTATSDSNGSCAAAAAAPPLAPDESVSSANLL